jgi:hypothetical protein
MDIYFADGRYGPRIDVYQKEMQAIEELILAFQELTQKNGGTFLFHDFDEFEEFRVSNPLLRNIVLSGEQKVELPKNIHAHHPGIFFYNSSSQNVYLIGILESMLLNVDLSHPITIIKWYGGNGVYRLEPGAEFAIYQDDELIKIVTTDEHGKVTFFLPAGIYWVVQTIGKIGHISVEPFELVVGLGRNDLVLDLYNEVIVVPDTLKRRSLVTPIILLIAFLLGRRHGI